MFSFMTYTLYLNSILLQINPFIFKSQSYNPLVFLFVLLVYDIIIQLNWVHTMLVSITRHNVDKCINVF